MLDKIQGLQKDVQVEGQPVTLTSATVTKNDISAKTGATDKITIVVRGLEAAQNATVDPAGQKALQKALQSVVAQELKTKISSVEGTVEQDGPGKQKLTLTVTTTSGQTWKDENKPSGKEND